MRPPIAYIFDPHGIAEKMRISVTGVTSYFKDKSVYAAYPEAAERGTHVHKWMEARCTGCEFPSDFSPNGVDCSEWFNQLQEMKSFWDQIEVLGCEHTMVSRKKSLGGQLDLLCKYKGKTLLVDLKSKSKSWTSPSKEDIKSYQGQAGGYLYLLQAGDDAQKPPFVDECRTLIVTPEKTKWLPAMTPDECSLEWEECWGAYAAEALAAF